MTVLGQKHVLREKDLTVSRRTSLWAESCVRIWMAPTRVIIVAAVVSPQSELKSAEKFDYEPCLIKPNRKVDYFAQKTCFNDERGYRRTITHASKLLNLISRVDFFVRDRANWPL